MKLRIRSMETKATTRIEIPDSSSLFDLKTLIVSNLSSSSSSSSLISPQSIFLSLNRRDELVSCSPGDSIHSLGLTSGDLLFYSFSPNPNPNSEPLHTPNSDSNPTLISGPTRDMEVEVEKCPENSNLDAVNVEKSSEESNLKTMDAADLALVSDPCQEMEIKADKSPESSDFEAMDDDDLDVTSDATGETHKSHSLPCFLQRVIALEKDEIKGNLGFLIVAVHAVLLESGFVVCSTNGSRLPQGWALETSMFSIQYTIPQLLDGFIEERGVKVATLKFSAMVDCVSIYGFLCGDRPSVYRLCLNVSNVAPSLVSALNSVGGGEEKEVFNLWKIVKDGLSLPLLIDICQNNGLPPPPCFVCLPIDLKIRIVELLHGVDVARVSCTGSELRYLASNDEIWKQKFEEEFGLVNERGLAAGITWKEKFKWWWLKRKDANKRPKRGHTRFIRFAPPFPPFAPQRFPMFGGDYDRLPVFRDNPGSMPGSGFLHRSSRRNFSPRCNLGGSSSHFIR